MLTTLPAQSPPNDNLTQFTRRVSFNNLNPESDVPSLPLYANAMSSSSSSSSSTANASTSPQISLLNDISKLYPPGKVPSLAKILINNASHSATTHSLLTPTRKKLKLPDPPSKSILKNKLSPQQLQYNLQHSKSLGINYHDDLNDIAEPDVVMNGDPSKTRRKSYSEMTDEELMALDPQFQTTKSKVTNVNQFKFDSQATYFLPSLRKASLSSSALKPSSVYTSSNDNNYKSISLTVKHKNHDQAAGYVAVDDDDTYINLNRTLLTVISGRRHTWNALDWLLNINDYANSDRFLIDGDYLVVTSIIPLKFIKDLENSKKKSPSADEVLYKKCQTLLDYIISQLPSPDLKLKITVEFITDVSADEAACSKKPLVGNKYMLTHVYKQYQPTLIIIGNRSTNLNFKYPMRISKAGSVAANESGNISDDFFSATSNSEAGHYLVKLSSYIIKYSTIPVIVVGNSTRHHDAAVPNKSGVLVTFKNPSPFTTSSKPIIVTSEPNDHKRKLSEESYSITSFNGKNDMETKSISSSDSSAASSIKQALSRLELASSLKTLAVSSDHTKFEEMIKLISTNSLSESTNYLKIVNNDSNPDTNEAIDGRIHEMYKSQLQGNNYNTRNGSYLRGYSTGGLLANKSISSDPIYKVKSLISYSEEDEKKNEQLLNSKRLKKINSQVSNSTQSSNNSLAASKEKKLLKKSSTSTLDDKKKKKSFFQRIGLKKT